MPVEDQIRTLLQRKGMNPENIRYNENLDQYQVNIAVEGTDNRFLEGRTEIGASEDVVQVVNSAALRTARGRIDESSIPDGTVRVKDTMRDSHYLLVVE